MRQQSEYHLHYIYFSHVQWFVNMLWESLYYRLFKLLIMLLLLASLLASMLMKKQRQGVTVQLFHILLNVHPCPLFHALQTTTNTYGGLFEDGKKAAVKINKSLASNVIKRRHYTDVILFLPFYSHYFIGDIEVFMKKTINYTNDFVETLVQQRIESSLHYSHLGRIYSCGHIFWVKDSVVLWYCCCFPSCTF